MGVLLPFGFFVSTLAHEFVYVLQPEPQCTPNPQVGNPLLGNPSVNGEWIDAHVLCQFSHSKQSVSHRLTPLDIFGFFLLRLYCGQS
jgi:hypothetical protein